MTAQQRADAIVLAARDKLVRSAEAGRVPMWTLATGLATFPFVVVGFVAAGWFFSHGDVGLGWTFMCLGMICSAYAFGLSGYLVGRIHASHNVAGFAITWLVNCEAQPQQFLTAILRDLKDDDRDH